METLRRFRLVAVRISLAITVVAALTAYWIGSSIIAQGIALGGVAGALAFWIAAVNVEKLAILPPKKVKLFTYKWTLIRLAIYALALIKAYSLDRETFHGLIAAVCGVMSMRVVLILLGITGWDLQSQEQAQDGQDSEE